MKGWYISTEMRKETTNEKKKMHRRRKSYRCIKTKYLEQARRRVSTADARTAASFYIDVKNK